jgi:hypothetical protein
MQMQMQTSSAFNRDAGGYLVLTPTPVKLQLDDSHLSADSPITIEPPPRSTEFINIPHPSPSRLVISLHPTQLTSYAFGVAASMDLSVLVSTTQLFFSRAAAHSRHALPMTALTISIPGPHLLPIYTLRTTGGTSDLSQQ